MLCRAERAPSALRLTELIIVDCRVETSSRREDKDEKCGARAFSDAALRDISRTVNLWVIPAHRGKTTGFSADAFRVFWAAWATRTSASSLFSFRRRLAGRSRTEASVDMANIQAEDILAGTPAVQCKTKVRLPLASAPAAFAPRRKSSRSCAKTDDPRAPRRSCARSAQSPRSSPSWKTCSARACPWPLQLLAGSHDYHQGTLDTLAACHAEHAPDVRGAAGHEGP